MGKQINISVVDQVSTVAELITATAEIRSLCDIAEVSPFVFFWGEIVDMHCIAESAF